MIHYVRKYVMRWNFISDLSYRYLPQRYSSRAIHMSLPKRISYIYQLKWIGKLHLEMISLVKNTEGHRITLGIARVCASRPNSGHIDNEHRDGRVTNYLRLETYCDMVGGLYYLHTRLCIEANNFGNYRNGYRRLWWEGDSMPAYLKRTIAITWCSCS